MDGAYFPPASTSNEEQVELPINSD